VVPTFDAPVGSEEVLEYLQFNAAEALAGNCRGADGAVVFDKQIAPSGKLFEPGHIALGRPYLGQHSQPLGHIGLAGEPLAVGCGDLPRTPPEKGRECRFAEFVADRSDQIDREPGMSIGKQRCRLRR
jgi:hypothetical protein